MPSVVVVGDFVAKNPECINISDNISTIIGKSDIRIVNFEAPVEGEGDAVRKSGPSLRQSRYSPVFLEKIGFNVILTANNHIMDYGKDSCFDTLHSFNKSLIVGAGNPEDAYAVKVMTIGDSRVGFLSLCQYENGVLSSPNSEELCGVAWINSLAVRDIISGAKAGLDYLIVLPHAGLEDFDAPLPEWRALYKQFVDWGADAVVATHTHCPQGWEIYNSRPIFYSLGNFYFDSLSGSKYWNKGLLVELELDSEISFKVTNIVFSKGVIEVDNTEASKYHNEELLSYLKDDKKYMEYIDECCNTCYKGYVYGLMRGLSAFSFRGVSLSLMFRLFCLMILGKKDIPTLLNTFRCETHRWVIERYLSKKLL